MIDTVTFDLWNTLIYTSPQDNLKYKNKRIDGFVSVLKDTGVNVSRDEIGKAYDKSFEIYMSIRDRNEDISTSEQVQIILQCLASSGLPDLNEEIIRKLEDVVAEAIFSELPDLVEGSEEILNYLDKQNYRIGLICNTGRTPGKILREVLKRRNIAQFFGVLTFSDELRIRKPNPEIFLHTLKYLNASPCTALHIGDELESDVLGAKKCGMQAAWISPDRDNLRSDLQSKIEPDFILPDLVSLKTILGQEKSA